eukprot:14472264-Alexandrium_andersonii.AAC.1
MAPGREHAVNRFSDHRGWAPSPRGASEPRSVRLGSCRLHCDAELRPEFRIQAAQHGPVFA